MVKRRFVLESHAAWVESTSCVSAPRGASTRKWDETRELVHDGTQHRRSLNFRFRSTPPIFGHRPQYGSEAAGQWAEERSKCYYQNCHHSRRVGEKWIGLLSERPLSEWAVESPNVEIFSQVIFLAFTYHTTRFSVLTENIWFWPSHHGRYVPLGNTWTCNLLLR